MKFGLIYELQLPRPWDVESEHRMVQDALAEVEVADRLGFDYVWANEHHFLEEYSHNSAPEVFLAAAVGRTRQIHVGHAVVLSPPGYNPPARVAERIAMLNLVSSGRAEWGTGSSASRAELEGFNVDPAQKNIELLVEMFCPQFSPQIMLCFRTVSQKVENLCEEDTAEREESSRQQFC
jgi:alkanesulfonate monooxygenase SsuD/methylene tetrahydromethanopterin reductase-like flavin-dependent oxidoreductase (luciferase family)